MANLTETETIENLAAEIGENIYMDVAKWHLYLADAHLHQQLAEQFYPMLVAGDLRENAVLDVLRSIPVKVGGGKRELPLLDLLPMQSQVNLMDLLEAFQRDL